MKHANGEKGNKLKNKFNINRSIQHRSDQLIQFWEHSKNLWSKFQDIT